mmetsp:Transcript_12593/g.39181  ORF Transcript_12593/g.39181 Transcript_12593/m.39181 type:complete len:200 (-) Transcript_12593:206-805(-)
MAQRGGGAATVDAELESVTDDGEAGLVHCEARAREHEELGRREARLGAHDAAGQRDLHALKRRGVVRRGGRQHDLQGLAVARDLDGGVRTEEDGLLRVPPERAVVGDEGGVADSTTERVWLDVGAERGEARDVEDERLPAAAEGALPDALREAAGNGNYGRRAGGSGGACALNRKHDGSEHAHRRESAHASSKAGRSAH